MYDDEPELAYPSRNRGSGYPLALGSTATTTTHRPYDDINEISSQGNILYACSYVKRQMKLKYYVVYWHLSYNKKQSHKLYSF